VVGIRRGGFKVVDEHALPKDHPAFDTKAAIEV
jgi:hypothetical protein